MKKVKFFKSKGKVDFYVFLTYLPVTSKTKIERARAPKECPNCKHRFMADWGLKPKLKICEIKSKDELRQLKDTITKWNEKDRLV